MPTELTRLVRGLPRLAPPVELRARVLAAYDAHVSASPGAGGRLETGGPPAGRLLWLRPALLGAAAAAAAVLLLGMPGIAGGLLGTDPSGGATGASASARSTRWVTLADAPPTTSAPVRFIDDPSLPLRLVAAGPLDGP